jgi:hypothetical protein
MPRKAMAHKNKLTLQYVFMAVRVRRVLTPLLPGEETKYHTSLRAL